MVDLYLAHHAPLQLVRGLTRRIQGSLFTKASGGDNVLGRPTSALSKGPAEDWTDYPFIIAALAPEEPVLDADGVPMNVQLRCEWSTTSPAVWTLTVEATKIEEAIALTGQSDRRLIYSIAGRKDTAGLVDDELLLTHGPVFLTHSAIHAGMVPLA